MVMVVVRKYVLLYYTDICHIHTMSYCINERTTVWCMVLIMQNRLWQLQQLRHCRASTVYTAAMPELTQISFRSSCLTFSCASKTVFCTVRTFFAFSSVSLACWNESLSSYQNKHESFNRALKQHWLDLQMTSIPVTLIYVAACIQICSILGRKINSKTHSAMFPYQNITSSHSTSGDM